MDSFGTLFPYINQSLHKCQQILSLIGLYFITQMSTQLLYGLFTTTYVHICTLWTPNVFHLTDAHNQWAIVVMVSNPCGQCLAKLLARKGFDLILIDNNNDMLTKLSKHISMKYKVNVLAIECDSSDWLKSCQDIERQIVDKNVTVLVNNMSPMDQLSDESSEYWHLSGQQILDVMNWRMTSLVMITSTVLRQMKSRRRGCIINVSSIVAIKPTPYMSLQSSSAAFVDHFSESLSYECRNYGIRVHSLLPSFRSNGYTNWLTAVMAPTHDDYANSALRAIGATRRSTGYLWHDLHYWLLDRCPQPVWSSLSYYCRHTLHSYLISLSI